MRRAAIPISTLALLAALVPFLPAPADPTDAPSFAFLRPQGREGGTIVLWERGRERELAPGRVAMSFDWSPDGRTICLANWVGRHDDMSATPAHLYRLDVGSGQVTELAAVKGYHGYDVDWAPGPHAASPFHRIGRAINVVDVAADRAVGVRPDRGMVDREPVWSPDGEEILFISDGEDMSGQLYIMNADGRHLRQVTAERDIVYHPAWSPDGERVACSAGGRIVTCRTDGSDRKELDAGFQPAWSPDGARIAYAKGVPVSGNARYVPWDGTGEVWVSDAGGGNARRVTAGNSPLWTRDGKLLVQAPEGIALVDPTGGSAERLTSGPGAVVRIRP